MDKNVEKLAQILSKPPLSLKRGKLPEQGSNCVAEETLEQFYQGTLSRSERTKIEQHLIACQYCFDRLVILDELSYGELVEVPERLVAKTKQMVFGSSHPILEIILTATQRAIKIIKNTGELLSPAPVLRPARGQESGLNQDQVYDFVTISKEFNGVKMDVHIECVNDSYKVILNASDPIERTPISGARLALFAGDRELSSVEDSEAVFYLKLRKYLIKILFEDKEIGEIHLDLRKAS